MSVRPHRVKARRALAEATWKFWFDRQGRLRRSCRCGFCLGAYRRERRDWAVFE